jgi:hypothetical protein
MVEISRIVAQNPWWKFGPDFALYDENLRRYNEASPQNSQEKPATVNW